MKRKYKEKRERAILLKERDGEQQAAPHRLLHVPEQARSSPVGRDYCHRPVFIFSLALPILPDNVLD
jgi:hypothetical protein